MTRSRTPARRRNAPNFAWLAVILLAACNQPGVLSEGGALDDADAQLHALENKLGNDPAACVDYLDLCQRANRLCTAIGAGGSALVCRGIKSRCDANLTTYCSGVVADGGATTPDAGTAPSPDASSPPADGATPADGAAPAVDTSSPRVDASSPRVDTSSPPADTSSPPPGGTKCAHDGATANVVVSSGDSLQSAISKVQSGGVIWVGPGTYTCVRIEQLAFTSAAPLIIRKDPTRPGVARIVPGSCYFTLRIIDSSYVAVDGLTVDGGGDSVYVEHSDHVILKDLDVMNPKQEGIQVRKSSSYVDIIGCHVHDTGVSVPKWGECIYLGTGGTADFPDHTDYVWMENNELDHCGAAEGINIKQEVFHATARNNTIHDIKPGTSDQYNQAALTVEGEDRNYLRSSPREVWLEGNQIYNVSLGRWANGVMVGGTGVYVVNNTIHDCAEAGVYGNSWGDLGLFLYVYNNTISKVGTKAVKIDSGIDLHQSDPGPNPHKPQGWYCH